MRMILTTSFWTRRRTGRNVERPAQNSEMMATVTVRSQGKMKLTGTRVNSARWAARDQPIRVPMILYTHTHTKQQRSNKQTNKQKTRQDDDLLTPRMAEEMTRTKAS